MGSNFSKTLREEEIEEIESETGCQSLLCVRSGISLTSQPFSHGKTDHETLQSLFELGQGKQRISWVRKKANRDCSIKLHRKRREDFQHIPEIAINPLGERIIDAFFEFVDLTYGGTVPYNFFYSQDDDDGVDQQARVNFRQFIRVLAQFRPVSSTRAGDLQLNAKAKKLRFVFDVYDLDKDEKISREDLTKARSVDSSVRTAPPP